MAHPGNRPTNLLQTQVTCITNYKMRTTLDVYTNCTRSAHKRTFYAPEEPTDQTPEMSTHPPSSAKADPAELRLRLLLANSTLASDAMARRPAGSRPPTRSPHTDRHGRPASDAAGRHASPACASTRARGSPRSSAAIRPWCRPSLARWPVCATARTLSGRAGRARRAGAPHVTAGRSRARPRGSRRGPGGGRCGAAGRRFVRAGSSGSFFRHREAP